MAFSNYRLDRRGSAGLRKLESLHAPPIPHLDIHLLTSQRIAIVGAGFAGLASATLLARAGHQVTVLEKFATPQAVGAGILIQPTGLAAMRTLGIYDEILAHGARVHNLSGVSHTGRQVLDIRYERWQSGSFGVGLHRGALFNALWKSATEAGVNIVTGQELKQLSELKDYDLRVIADGANSQLRGQTGLPFKDKLYPWGAVWAVLPDPERHYGSTLWQWCKQANQMLGIMPTGFAPSSDTPVVSLFWSLRADRFDDWRKAGLQAWKNSVLALNPACAELLANISSIDQLTWARYHDIVMPSYHTDSEVVIGDAAHATSPQLGQGTNLALLDAVALAKCLATASSIPSALAAYTQTRKSHLHFYSQASRLLTPLFQSDLTVLPWFRDRLMATSSTWPVLKNMNLQTLVGVRKGWLGGELELK
jgi:2-polyprenyl-6-methoxyphenol hydroxylase-like FAD-dependent oxidoreductase